MQGAGIPGQPALRLRWLSPSLPKNPVGRIVATRQTLLQQSVQGMDLLGLPDPLMRIPALMDTTIHGSQSTIHGDLNLENILIGPGGMVWLIDFAQTRDGHTLLDFAHLETETIAHLIAPRIASAKDYLALLSSMEIDTPTGQLAVFEPQRQLLITLHQIAYRCLFNQSREGEFHLSLALTCLGALKYANLSAHQKYFLYLTAAYLLKNI